MNNVLELKGKRFVQASKQGQSGGATMNNKKTVLSKHLIALKSQLIDIKEFWRLEKRPFSGVLVSVYYNKVVAKSNRIAGLFKGKDSNFAIVGAKFNEDKSKHIITYFLDVKDLDKSIELLDTASAISSSYFSDGINKSIFDNKTLMDKIPFCKLTMAKTNFKQVIADVSYIDDFKVELPTSQMKQSIITLYNIGIDTKTLLKDIGIDILSSRILD